MARHQTFKIYIRDMVGVIIWFVAGMLLAVTTLWLSSFSNHHVIGVTDALYAILLFLVMGAFGLTFHYIKRRDFLQAVSAQLASLGSLEAVDALSTASKLQMDRLFLQLLRQYVNQANESIQSIQEKRVFYEHFTTRFAHQMKTPLTVLQLLTSEMKTKAGEFTSTHDNANLKETLRDNPLSPEEVWQIAMDMEQEQERLSEAIETMLQTVRLQSFSFDAQMAQVQLGDLLRKVVNAHKTAWIRAKIFPTIHFNQQDQAFVYTDAKWLQFIIEQIIRNALQYGYKVNAQGERIDEPNEFQIHVEVTTASVSLSFVDHGIGMLQRDKRRVFEPFFTGQNGRAHSRATGMGLYLATTVAKRLGIKISLTSELHKGTRVQLSIPTAQYLEPFFQRNMTKL